MALIKDKRAQVIQRLVMLAYMNNIDGRMIKVHTDGVHVPPELLALFTASVAGDPINFASVPSEPCPRGGASAGSVGPVGPAGPVGRDGLEGPEGTCECPDPVPCNLELQQCGSMDPDVAWVFIQTFECLEGLGLLTDSWRAAFPQMIPTEG